MKTYIKFALPFGLVREVRLHVHTRLLKETITTGVLIRMGDDEGVGVSGAFAGGNAVEFEGDAVGALVEDRARIEGPGVDHILHYFAILH